MSDTDAMDADSGYASQGPNSPRPGAGKAPDLGGELSEFDKTVDDAVIKRFTNVEMQIEQPMLRYISRFPAKKYRPMALRLMVLGTTEVDARPHIVVLCLPTQARRVRKFFDKESVRALCQPDDDTLPSFAVHIHPRAPETKGGDDDAIEVFVPIQADATYCGAPIRVYLPSDVEKRATFGGIIKVVAQDRSVKLYGLTAGHILADDGPDETTLMSDISDEMSAESSFGVSDSDSKDDDSMSELDQACGPPLPPMMKQ